MSTMHTAASKCAASFLAILCGAFALAAAPDVATPQPMNKQAILTMLAVDHAFWSPREITREVRQRGADFQLQPETERELRKAGAKDAVIEAVRASYRAPAVEEGASAPFPYFDPISSANAPSAPAILEIKLVGLRPTTLGLTRESFAVAIAQVGQQILEIFGENVTVARVASNRFAVLLPTTSPDQLLGLGDRVIAALSAPITVDGRELLVDPRIGCASASPGEDVQLLLAHARQATDVASQRPAEQPMTAIYDASIDELIRERRELEDDLRAAVVGGNLLLAFQPIVRASDGQVVAAEALLRWAHPRRGSVAPLVFIPVAEECGLILAIGRWVLNEACYQAASWPAIDGTLLSVSVNASPLQIADAGFVADVAEALQRSGLPASRLRIEITEGLAVEDVERTIGQIQALRNMGVETMLDDFGTGHSSLAWLQRLPVSCIKIDRVFVNGIADDSVDRAIVQASLFLSRALGAEIVAEGVETDAQRLQLVRMGCERMQGYLFSRPLHAERFASWVDEQRAEVEALQHRTAA